MTDKKAKLPAWWPNMTTALIYCGALANISLWIRAGDMVESGGWSTVSSVALGVSMSFGPVQIVKQWGLLKPTFERTVKGVTTSRPNPRWWLAIGSFAVILTSEGILLAPVVMAMLTKVSLSAVLGCYAFAWSFGRVLVSAVAVAGLAAVTGAHAPKSEAVKADNPAQIAVVPESAPKSAEVPAMVRCTEPGCNMEYASKGGKGGHYKKHHAPVRIDISLLNKKESTK